MRYPSGSRTKQRKLPPSRTWYGGRSGSQPRSPRPAGRAPAGAPERAVEVVDADRDVAVAGPELVRAAVVVERQLEHRLGVAEREEVVRRFLLAVPDDVHVAVEGEAQRLVERTTVFGIGDAHHRVQKGC